MIVEYALNGFTNNKSEQADMYAIGDCLVFELEKVQHVFKLTSEQWKVLTEVASQKVD